MESARTRARRISVVGAFVLCLAGAAATPAAAQDRTTTLGTPSGPVLSSTCAAGSVVTGLAVSVEWREYVGEVAALCRDANGNVTAAPKIGSLGEWEIYYYGTSSCADGETANGIGGRAGDIIDSVRIGCAGADGPLVGGSGGAAEAAHDCAAGSHLVGVEGTTLNYFWGYVVSSLTGVCAVSEATTKEDCKDDGWKRYGDRYRNQGDCVSDVATKGEQS